MQAVEAAHKVMIKDKVVEVKLAIPREEMPPSLPSNGVVPGAFSEMHNRAIRPRTAAFQDESTALALLQQLNPPTHLNPYFMAPRAMPSDAFLPRAYNLPLGLDFPTLHAGGAGGGLMGLESQIPSTAFGSLPSDGLGPDVQNALFRSQGAAWGFADL